jgi:membrane protease YdiL (CAAX protease family)
MHTTQTHDRESARRRCASWARTAALTCVAALLAVGALANYRPLAAVRSEDAVSLLLDCTVRARKAYATLPSRSVPPPHVSSEGRRLLADFTRLAELEPSVHMLRRLAIMQYVLGDAGWKASLLRMRELPSRPAPADAEHELALWRSAFEGHPSTMEIRRLRAGIQGMELGWFQHLALEVLYSRSGMAKEAAMERSAAQRSSGRLALASLVGLGLALLGLLIGIFAARRLWTKYRDPYAPLPAALTPEPSTQLDRHQGNTLYIVFLVYILSLAAIRVLAPAVVSALVDDSTYVLSPIQTVLLTVTVSILSLVPPLLTFLLLAPQAGLTAGDLGFRTSNVRLDLVWGVAGYMVALPIVWAANEVSSWLFQGVRSPTHPALVELAAGQNLPLQVLLLFQAVLLAPVAEETLFRGVFFRSLTPRAGRTMALLLASGVFALLHPQLPLGFLGLFVLGATFNVLYLFRGSLLPCMVAHALNNAAILTFFNLLVGD